MRGAGAAAGRGDGGGGGDGRDGGGGGDGGAVKSITRTRESSGGWSGRGASLRFPHPPLLLPVVAADPECGGGTRWQSGHGGGREGGGGGCLRRGQARPRLRNAAAGGG